MLNLSPRLSNTVDRKFVVPKKTGVSFHSTELALDSSENVRGNYLSNDDIDDHMNLQLTTILLKYKFKTHV